MTLIERISNEPVVVLGVVEAVVYLLTEYGVAISSGQQAAVLGLVAAVLTALTRQRVTPTS